MKTVVGIRCHEIGEIELKLYEVLLTCINPSDIYFLLDCTKFKGYDVQEKQIILVNPERQLIPAPSVWGWLCGDLFYYAFAARVQSDFYVMVEPDVVMTPATAESIFLALGRDNSDYIAHDIKLASEEWMWTPTIQPFVKQVYASAFPFTRLSRKALEFLYPQRRQVNHLCATHKIHIPNDESFVTSGLMNVPGFQLTSLTNIVNINTSKFSTVHQIPAEFCNKDGYIYHSALSGKCFYNKLVQRIQSDSLKESIFQRLDYAFLGENGGAEFLATLRGIVSPEIASVIDEWNESRCLSEVSN